MNFWIPTCYNLQLHLFDVDIPGDITFKESDTLTAGDEATIVDTGSFISANT